MTKTDKEKMLAGELYQAFTQELNAERAHAKDLCFQLNQTRPGDEEKRRELVHTLLGVNDAIVESPFHCDYGYNIKVGQGFYANHGCTILDCNVVTIGNKVMLGPGVVVSAAHHPLSAKLRADGELAYPISIGDNVWVGANVTILPGVIIGSNVVVGAGAVVTKNIPDNVVCGGVPARIIRHLSSDGEPITEGDM
jgi:maltose O-acetyltransferase